MSDEPHVNRVPDFSDLFLWNLTPVESARTGFHMPGHVNARSFDDEYARRLLLTDTTELSRTDDLHGPGGPVLHAAESLAKTYGSGQSFFITTGSTTGIRAMMAAVAHEKTFFLLPRAVHVSVLYTLVILGASYAFFPATIDNKEPSEPIRRITPEDVRAGLSLYPQTTDVLLVSPDYYGCCADLAAIASVVHDAGARLLVDEAHGAHLRFCPAGGPQDAMSSGADISVMSLHKTLPALTMSSILHVSSAAITCGRVDPEAILAMLRVFETSSPSFLIAASSEYAVAWAREDGQQRIADVIKEKIRFLRCISQNAKLSRLVQANDGDYVEVDPQKDPLRMVLRLRDDAPSGIAIGKALEHEGVDIEMADLRRLVLILSPWHRRADFDNLQEALETVAEKIWCRSGVPDTLIAQETVSEMTISADETFTLRQDIIAVEEIMRRCLADSPEAAEDVRAAFFSKSKDRIRLDDSEGRIAGDPVVPYPPGVPLLWPGERIGSEHIACITNLLMQGITVAGIKEERISVLSCENANGTKGFA